MNSSDIQDDSSIQKGNTEVSNNLLKIGSELKKSREEKNISIKKLAESLRIGEEQLVAIENGNEDLLPEKVFIKAMIQRVAEKLQIDSKSLLEDFTSDKTSFAQDISEKISQQTQDSKILLDKRNVTYIKYIIFGVICILSLGISRTIFSRSSEYSNNQSLSNRSVNLKESLGPTKGIGVKIRSIKPSKAKILDSEGRIIFNGIIKGQLIYPERNILEIYASNPNLIEIEIKGKKSYNLGEKSDLGWHKIEIN